MNKHVNLALKTCKTSDHREQKMGSVLVRSGAVLGAEPNKKWNHAESRVLRPHLNCSGTTLYIMRENKKTSKPCPKCMIKIRLAGVSVIVYVDSKNKLVKEKVL